MNFILNFLLKIGDFIDFLTSCQYRALQFLQPFFKKDVYFFMDTNCPYTELIDAYSLFCYMKEHGHCCYYIVDKNHPAFKKIKKAHPKNLIVLNSKKTLEKIIFIHFFKFLRLRFFFIAWGFSKNYSLIERNLYENKYIDSVFLQHGVILLKKFMFDIYSNKVFNKMLVSNDYEKEIVQKNMGYADNQLIKAALPRFDLLERGAAAEIFAFFTWRMTFNTVNYKDTLYYKNIKSLLENKKLNELLKTHNVKLKMAFHHTFLEGNNSIKFSDNVEVIDSTKISDTIKKANLLITDYSSIWSDFLFLEKPVIFYRLDYNEEKLIKVDKDDLEFAKSKDNLLFNTVYDEAQVVNLIEKYVKNSFTLEEENKKIAARLFYARENVRGKILEELDI